MSTAFETITSIRADVQHSKQLGNGKLTHDAPSVPLELLFQGRVMPMTGGSNVKEHRPTAKERAARVKHDKLNPYADKGRKSRRATGQATCEALFTFGERFDDEFIGPRKREDGFSRTIALRYLTKRMVFRPRGNAKGKEDAPTTVKARKTSSSRHSTAFYVASDIEDIIQDAFILYMTGRKETGEKLYNSGNRLHDTCNACRDAKNAFTRRQWKERKRLDILAAKMKAREDKERSKANRVYDAELEQLLDAVRTHGTNNATELASILGTYPMDISRRFARIRARVERS